jgi:hypothetical protein
MLRARAGGRPDAQAPGRCCGTDPGPVSSGYLLGSIRKTWVPPWMS